MDPHRKSVQNAGGFASGARTATPFVVRIPPWGISIFKAYLLVVIPGRGLYFPPKRPQNGIQAYFLVVIPGRRLFFTPKDPKNAPLDRLWAPFGSVWLWDPPGGPKVDFLIDVCSRIGGLEFSRGSPGSPGSRGSPGTGSGAAVQTLPSTRRGLRMT